MRWTARLLVMTLVAVAGGAAYADPLSATTVSRCNPAQLTVGHFSWVSPPTGLNMSGVRVTNIGRRACALSGAPKVSLTGRGLPVVRAVANGLGLNQIDEGPIRVVPGRWASLLFATSHDCVPTPTTRYDRMTIRIGRRSFSLAIPHHPGLDLRFWVSPSCPPAVSRYLHGSHLSR